MRGKGLKSLRSLFKSRSPKNPKPDLLTLKPSVAGSNKHHHPSKPTAKKRIPWALVSPATVDESLPVASEDSTSELRNISNLLCASSVADSFKTSPLQGPDDVINSDENLFTIPWISNTSSTQAFHRRKALLRMRKAKWVFEKTQRRRFNLLVRNSVDKLGSKVALEVFGKLGRDTSVKEYNTLIGSCLEKARQSLDEDDFEDQVCYAYRLYTMMREQGFTLEEETYGPFLLFFVDMGMVEEFEYFCKDIKGDNFVSYRMGYYEMLLWIRVGDEDKVWELWNSIGEVGKEDSYKLAENYLLAFCKADRKEELLQLLEAVDITRISSVENIGYIFMTLGRLLLENFVEKFILALKNSDAMEESISSFIYNYVTSMPNLAVEEVVSKFKELHERLEVASSFASYEKLINLCCDCLKVHEALSIVDHMCQSDLAPSIKALRPIIRASGQSCELNLVHQIYPLMRSHNLKPDKRTFRNMISFCVKMKDFEGAYNILADAEDLYKESTTIMYNAILAEHCKEKNGYGISVVLKQMKDKDVDLDSETFSYLISTCESEEDIAKCCDQMHRSGIQVTKQVYMALISAYANCGKFDEAKQVILDEAIPVKYLNEIKSALVSALSSNGLILDALQIYDEIKETGFKPEPRTIINLIEHLRSEGELNRLLELLEGLNGSNFWFEGCARIILYCIGYKHISDAVELLKQLKEKNESATDVVVDQIYNQISGMDSPDLEVGLKILQHLKELKIRPSRTSLDFLLSACVTARDSQSAQLIFKEYQSAGFPFNVLTYLRMYQVLLASGEYESASNMMKKMPKSDPHVRLIIEECQKTYGHGSMPVKEKKGSIAVQ
ncbi:Pentatricopeptide repeat-containing protein [Acorus gramineus]|uniref:Pentatricopeptide repeat-containing protein n=1 Tax=Acorus gramineus TaxID=55184 RepID=A0AAV9BXC1_ACOGR|nr:Pentatricopeptide repeat-containing protein [Acorus gramineus]